jgi:GH15 family glucan-1,4-alpha-glucosidase
MAMRSIAGEVPQGANAFPPIASYALLSDCEACALVAPGGGIEWMCLPRVDSPSVFGTILDRDAGAFRLAPSDVSVPTGRRYLPGTMILETTWGTATGWMVVRDALLVGRWHHHDERSLTHRRAPTDHDADHVLLRTVRCINGRVDVRMECEPKPDYARAAVSWRYDGPGYRSAIGVTDGSLLVLRLQTDLNLGFEGGRALARTTLHDGDAAFFALAWSDHPAPTTLDEAEERLEATMDFWHEWLSHGSFPDHPWRTYLQRSALTLKGLTYAPTGALVAAPTTSLPETPGGVRNWDYRYSWIRDSTFALWGLYTLGFEEEADDFFYFVRDVAKAETDHLQIMYGVGGESELPEQELEHLSGYAGARPVRIGNDAYRQAQHDVWGALLDSIWLHTESRDGLAESSWAILRRQVEEAIAHWREPDHGIWEVRGEPRHFLSSKVMCWVACDRGARLALLREDEEHAARWRDAADEIHPDVCRNGVDARGVLVQHYETTALDASCLLAVLLGFLPPDDDRMIATVEAVAEELTVEGLVLRYRTDETDDGLVGVEGAFTTCSFWLVSALAEIGQTARARALCERVLGHASPLLLYGEEIDIRSGRHLGNFPQGLTHLALINAVMHVIRADEQLVRRQSLLDSRRRQALPR